MTTVEAKGIVTPEFIAQQQRRLADPRGIMACHCPACQRKRGTSAPVVLMCKSAIDTLRQSLIEVVGHEERIAPTLSESCSKTLRFFVSPSVELFDPLGMLLADLILRVSDAVDRAVSESGLPYPRDVHACVFDWLGDVKLPILPNDEGVVYTAADVWFTQSTMAVIEAAKKVGLMKMAS